MKNHFLADVVVTIHLAFMLFVLLAQVLIVAGWLARWRWVRNFWFRVIHLASIGIVAAQAVAGIECPLTTVERQLRGGHLHPWALTPEELAERGLPEYHGEASAIGVFCNEVLFVSPPSPEGKKVVRLALMAVYLVFALLVVLTLVFAPPRWPWRREPPPGQALPPDASSRGSGCQPETPAPTQAGSPCHDKSPAHSSISL
jgi:hypothetical protein